MNTSFMRLLAQRLEHLSWTELALFEAKASPVIQGGLDVQAFRKTLTSEVASKVLRRAAAGVFPSVLWEDCP